MKKTTGVSLDEQILKLAKEGAFEARISFSKFVEEAIRLRVNCEILDGMKKKPVKAKSKIESTEETAETILEAADSKIIDGDEKMLKDAQERSRLQSELDKSREKRDIKQERLAAGRGILAKEPVTNLMGFTGGYSKDHQTRKKGVKC